MSRANFAYLRKLLRRGMIRTKRNGSSCPIEEINKRSTREQEADESAPSLS